MSTDMTCYDSSVKLLITGMPKSGKSTLLESLVSRYNGVAQGFITREITDGEKRTGFEIITSNGDHALLAQTEIETDFPVGRFFAMPDNISKALKSITDIDLADLLYIDEIGQMQLLSREFKALLSSYLNSNRTFLASVSQVFDAKEIEYITGLPDSILFTLTESTRSDVEQSIDAVLRSINYTNGLPASVKHQALKLARKYLKDENYTSFRKLFNNAVRYYQDQKITMLSKSAFTVLGNHTSHSVELKNANQWSCDCALANGKKPYLEACECSHYQAVLLLLSRS